MESVFYPEYKKGTKVRIVGKSKYAGELAEISQDVHGSNQLYFRVKMNNGKSILLHGDSLKIELWN